MNATDSECSLKLSQRCTPTNTTTTNPQQAVAAAETPLQVATASGAQQHVAVVIVVAMSLQAAGEWLWRSTTRATYSSSGIGSGINTRGSEV